MATIDDRISSYLKTHLSTDTKQLPVFDRNHIFFSILEFALKNSSVGEREVMLFSFSNYEKILSHARSGQIKMAAYMITCMDERCLRVSTPAAQYGMDGLYYPMMAYYAYVCKNYSDAIGYLNKAFDSIDQLYVCGFDQAIRMKLEQTLNLFKVLHAEKKIDQAVSVAKDLIRYLLGHQLSFHSVSSKTIYQNDDEWLATCHYYINSIIYQIIRKNDTIPVTESTYVDVLCKEMSFILSSDNIDDRTSDLHNTLQLIAMMSYCDLESIMDFLENHTIFSHNVPTCLRYFIIEYIKMIALKQNIIFSNSVNSVITTYYQTALGLDSRFIKF